MTFPMYTHVAPGDPDRAAAQAKELADEGFTALKTDPFMPEMRQHHRRYMKGEISPAGAALGADTIAAMRQAVGPDVEILIDAHGNFNVPTAIRMARKLESYDIGWFEEPVQPNSNDALRAVRDAVDVPLCVGERLYHRWDFVPILTDRLAEYLMPDILWCGGISEMRKIANLAESFYIPVSPHDASGPVNILAGAHVMMTVPNFYKLEFNPRRPGRSQQDHIRATGHTGRDASPVGETRPRRRTGRGLPRRPLRPRLECGLGCVDIYRHSRESGNPGVGAGFYTSEIYGRGTRRAALQLSAQSYRVASSVSARTGAVCTCAVSGFCLSCLTVPRSTLCFRRSYSEHNSAPISTMKLLT